MLDTKSEIRNSVFLLVVRAYVIHCVAAKILKWRWCLLLFPKSEEYDQYMTKNQDETVNKIPGGNKKNNIPDSTKHGLTCVSIRAMLFSDLDSDQKGEKL